MARQSAGRQIGRPRLIDAPCPGHAGQTYAEVIIKWIRDGAPLRLAAQAAGISWETLRGWRADGRDGGDPRYVAFLAQCEQAEAEGAMELLTRLNIAGITDWRASLALLERRYNEDFGRHRVYRDEPASPDLAVAGISAEVAEAAARQWQAYLAGVDDGASRARDKNGDEPALPAGD